MEPGRPHQDGHAPSLRAEVNPSEVFSPSDEFSSSLRAGVETHDGGGAFVPEVEGLSLRASHQLLCMLAGRNGSSLVQKPQSPRVAPSRHAGAAAVNSATALSTTYGAAPSFAEERPPAQAATTPRAKTTALPPPSGQQPPNSPPARTPDAPGSRGGRMPLPDVTAAHSRGRQWWGVLAARTSRTLRRSGVLPAATGRTGAQLLTGQVGLTVKGETAPQELLTRLGGGSVAASGAARPSAERRGVGRRSPAPQGDTPQTFPDAGPNRFTTGGGSAVLPNQARSPGPGARQLQASATAEASAPGLNTSLMSVNDYLSGAETSLPGVAASPVVVQSLPPLLPPPLKGMPVLPIALATAREGAREESRETAEDLDALAAKIKLILDEQARRHGIDV